MSAPSSLGNVPAVTPDEPVTVTLSRPVQHDGQVLDRLVLSPVRGRHVRQAGLVTVDEAGRPNMGDWLLRLAAPSAGVPLSVIDDLCAADAQRVSGIVAQWAFPLGGTGSPV